jgi:two-component system, NtrC family, nitrogen regulation response regulator NtrX
VSTALIVEDDARIRANLVYRISRLGLDAEAVASAEEALERLATFPCDLLVLDVRLPGMSGVELVRRLTSSGRLPPTVIVSGEASVSEAVEALQLGVHDFIEKPFSPERLERSVRNTLDHAALKREVARLEAALVSAPEILGTSPAIEELRAEIARVAPTDARVLICGESGSGKELVADAIHRGSPRAERPFIRINCAAMPAHLIEDELFGHVRGAFTDARTAKAGLFEEADGGTLFLDEIGDMPLELQGRLLRVLEDGRVRRLGETRDRGVDVRVVAATHTDIEAAVAAGRFREDLYFRLAHLPLDVPPLRERAGDVRLLFDHFLEHYWRHHRMRPRRVEPDVYPILEAYPWPGNVRELKALAERLVVFGADPVTVSQLPERYRSPSDSRAGVGEAGQRGPLLPLKEFKHQAEREYLARVLRETRGNVAAAARLLGVQRTHLHQRLVALGVPRPEEDGGDS